MQQDDLLSLTENNYHVTPTAHTIAPPRKEKDAEVIKGNHTSIHTPSSDDTNFEPMSHRVCNIFREKLEKIKNTKRSKMPDLLLGITCMSIGCIIGAAFTGTNPISSIFHFILYLVLACLTVGCGTLYFSSSSKSDLNIQGIASELLGHLPNSNPPTTNKQ